MDNTSIKPKLFTELKKGYSFNLFRHDLFSGITVGIVAIPLAMAFAIASGTTPDKGLFTAVIAGFFISLLGGSRFQIGGPTGAFVVIIYGVIERQGYDGLIIATLIAGLLLIILGLSRVGSYIKFIPYPVTTGFTAGIALVIFSTQVKDFFGLTIENMPAEFYDKWIAYFQHLTTFRPASAAVGIGTLGIILAVRRFTPRVPAHVVAITVLTAVVWIFGIPAETVGDRFGALPSGMPMPHLPSFSVEKIRLVFPDAIAIALLAGVESLLSAVVADGMTGGRHRSNTELVAQGVANIMSGFFGGIPATGAIARTATNVKTGAKTPVSGIIHSLTILIFILLLSDVAAHIPLAALSGVLFIVSWDMSEIKQFKRLLSAPKSDTAVLLLTFLLTIFVDLTVAVQVGVVLAALLFMKRMSDVTVVESSFNFDGEDEENDPHRTSAYKIPDGVEVYEIDGPFFFGVADRLAGILGFLQKHPKVFILRMRKVPSIDATGEHALEEFCTRCRRNGTQLILSGVQPIPFRTLDKMGFVEHIGRENITDHISKALKRAEEIGQKA
jgi:SulP family sulfate permease